MRDILIACVDGLKGLPEAIHAIFPAEIQLCVIHLIRNSFKYIPHKHAKECMGDLQSVYQAEAEDRAKEHLDQFHAKWGAKIPSSSKNVGQSMGAH